MYRNNTKSLPKKWVDFLQKEPESGMGYQIVSIILKNGKEFQNVVVVQAELITEVKGMETIPFEVDEIEDIKISAANKYWGSQPNS